MKQKGQSLVEMALITPLLLVMLLGLFEAGYQIRTYLVLVNANREAARFLSKEGVYTPEQTYEHFSDSLSRQIPFTGTMLIHLYDLAMGNPFCSGDETDVRREYIFGQGNVTPVFNTTLAAQQAITIGLQINQATYERDLGEAEIRCTRDGDCELYNLLLEFKDCPKYFSHIVVDLKWHYVWDQERLIAVETFYENPQLFGFFGEYKIPMYAHTSAREHRSRHMPPRVIPFGSP